MNDFLFHILVVLLAAKLAAELAERAGLPAVVGEIVAGIAVGPSVFNLVGRGDEVLLVLGEIGAILLLLQVGLEMDLGELAAVGRASLTVAVIGVVLPFVAGAGTGLAFGMEGKEAVFAGAALTATSVGITARVFGDLGVLATVEARTVLGAAVADDVIGLVLLTVVVRIATEGSVSVATVAAVMGVAVGFLVVAGAFGVRFAPPMFGALARVSRSGGTVVAVALAFTLAFAHLAEEAKLAPIVGAFVAGLALARAPVAGQVRRELAPVGHLFIPVFFLQIGIEAEIGRFADGRVLALASALLVVGVAGKLASAAGLLGSPGDRLLVGLGMVPRGEVGLIFATIGLRERIFGQDEYAAVLLVVLITTLVTPPLLRHRLRRMGPPPAVPGPAERPEGGWLLLSSGSSGAVIELAATPGPGEALAVALEAALNCEKARPGTALLDWVGSLPDGPLRWTPEARQAFFRLLDEGGPRSWRFLDLTGVLRRALPELGEALARRQTDPAEVDPLGAMRWPRLEALGQGWPGGVPARAELRLAAVILDISGADPSLHPVVAARRVSGRLELTPATEEAVAQLVGDAELLPAAANRSHAFEEEPVLQLASHLDSVEQARAGFALARTDEGLSQANRRSLDVLEELVVAALLRPELAGREAGNMAEERRRRAAGMVVESGARQRVEAAPRAYVLAVEPGELAAHAALLEPPLADGGSRVLVTPGDGTAQRVAVAARDRIGLLATQAAAVSRLGLTVNELVSARWPDGTSLSVFIVNGPPVTADVLEREMGASEPAGAAPMAFGDVALTFDNVASPWHTICSIAVPDRPGLLQGLAGAFARANVQVHSARGATPGGTAVDCFELTDSNGAKLGPDLQGHLSALVALGDGLPVRRRFLTLKRPC